MGRTQLDVHTRQHVLITPMELTAIKPVWYQQPPIYDTGMLWTVCCTCFFGFLRASEFTVSSSSAFDPAPHLTSQDITTDSHESQTLVRLHFKQSKRDPFRRDADVYLAWSANDMCQVLSLLAYMAVKARSGLLFIFSDFCPLSRVRLVQEVQRPLSSAGVRLRSEVFGV